MQMHYSDSRQLTDQAWALVDARCFQEANTLFAKLCELTPHDPEAWMMRGATQMELGDNDKSVGYLKQAIELDAAYADPYLHLGKLALISGRTVEAQQYGEKAIELDPLYAEAWVLLGAVHGSMQNHSMAEQCSRKGLGLNPQSIQAFVNLAHALRGQNRLDEAIEHYQQALVLQPDLEDVRLVLGDINVRLGHFDQAEAFYKNLLLSQPENAKAWQGLGNLQVTWRRFEEAIQSFKWLLEIRPDDASAHNDLGNAYLALDDHVNAERCYREALRLSTDISEAYANLGLILQARGNLPEAVDLCRKALDLKPNSAPLHQKLATALEFLGQYDEAITHCNLAQSFDPDYIGAVAAKGRILLKKGKYQECRLIMSPLLDNGRANAETKLVFADACAYLGESDYAVAVLQTLLDEGDLIKRERQQVHAALGRIYDKTESYDLAFTHFQQSNALKIGNFDLRKYESYVNCLISTFTPGFFSVAPCSKQVSELPVFIVGMPRSGTSLVEQILSSHPSVFGAGELGDIQTLTRKLSKLHVPVGYPQCLNLMSTDEVANLALTYLQKLRDLSVDALRIIDKMPHNFMHLGLIQLLFPKARVIHVSRDPLDTCISCYTQEFTSAHSYAYDLKILGAYYKQYERLMQHWIKVLKIPILHVQYENLVENQESISRKLIEFCGLEWDDCVMNFHQSNRDVATASYDQVRQPMYRKSVQRWKNYEPHLAPLLMALK